MQRILSSQLEYPGDGLYYLDGEPFSGVSYTLRDGWEKSETEIRQGLQWGTTKEWYEPGRPMREATFFKGVLHGRAREWHKNGQLAEDGEYEYGITLWEKSWDERGTLLDDFRLSEDDEDFQVLQEYRALYRKDSSA